MEQHSSGGKLLLRSNDKVWVALEEAYLTEATSYEWKYIMDDLGQLPSIYFCGLALFPHRVQQGEAYGHLTTPFQSGKVHFQINGVQLETYIYPDSRKMTEEQYHLMLNDILKEASLCFEYSHIEAGIDADQHSRELSLAQWCYIESSFALLTAMIWSIIQQPIRMLQASERQMRRDRVKSVEPKTLAWMEQNRGRGTSSDIPETVKSTTRTDSYNTYENKLLKRWLVELRHLLKMYGKSVPEEQAVRAESYADKVGYWLQDPFFKQVSPYKGVIRITQVFRKHPSYRQCYHWFDRLYKHGAERIGMSYHYPLRETFALYEIWCYMQLVKLFREKGLLEDSSGLFRTTREGLFLHFAEHNESMVKLKNDMRLSYQRVFQSNSPRFYTYTQRMIPDIVIEAGDTLYVLDPKYRVAANLGTALGEMHKYRDGILRCCNDSRAVHSVFILTPVQDAELNYFRPDFHNRYRMGAIALTPGGDTNLLSDWIYNQLVQGGGETT
ncbi:DUF2357 domain-containing protein [Paenibacillus mesophilus]|uniref:DUF2357 domain-containing protein n=1 Tax=Paenibacillus mesophilus TaxID=2582849 RepID=UPI00110D33DD|nr:DUF2357 domain-containing protein [Paenibacillus mesophilus]TMV47038.1 DUF2357 domain-containing protein [Paenibacillus mesophilus]